MHGEPVVPVVVVVLVAVAVVVVAAVSVVVVVVAVEVAEVAVVAPQGLARTSACPPAPHVGIAKKATALLKAVSEVGCCLACSIATGCVALCTCCLSHP